jgi:hypothetical protein
MVGGIRNGEQEMPDSDKEQDVQRVTVLGMLEGAPRSGTHRDRAAWRKTGRANNDHAPHGAVGNGGRHGAAGERGDVTVTQAENDQRANCAAKDKGELS